MLGSKRIDALLEYPPVFEKVREKNAIDTAIHAVSLKDIPEYGVGYVLCSKSDEGEKAIKAISRQLREVTKQRAYLDVHLSAMPASFKQEMLRYYNEVYGTDFTLTPMNQALLITISALKVLKSRYGKNKTRHSSRLSA